MKTANPITEPQQSCVETSAGAGKVICANNEYWRIHVEQGCTQILGLWTDPAGQGCFGENLLDVGDMPRQSHFHHRLKEPLGVSIVDMDTRTSMGRDCVTHWTSRDEELNSCSLQTELFSPRIGVRTNWELSLTDNELTITLSANVQPGGQGRLGLMLHTPRDFAFRRSPERFDKEHEWHELEATRSRPYFLHASGAYCDFEVWAEGGLLCLYHRYMHHQGIGVVPCQTQSAEFQCTLHLRPIAQGTRVPLCLQTPHCEMGAVATEFYDTYHMANVATRGIKGNGPYHACVCTMDLYGIIAPDEVACQRNVPVDVDALHATTRRTLELVATGAIQDAWLNGIYFLDHWDKGCGDAADAFMLDGGPHIALGIFQHFIHTGDRDWLKQMWPAAQRVMEMTLQFDRDGDGLVESLATGLADSHASNWWDEIKYGHKDANTNAWLYAALNAMADLAQVLDDAAVARQYREQADQLQRSYNEQLWNPATNRYVGWRDINGAMHDAFYISPNLLAIIHGLAPADRALRILQGIDNSPHAYRLFAISSNLESPPPGDLGYQQPFGHYENGGVFLINAAWDILARARFQGQNQAFTKFATVMEQYQVDRLYGRPFYDATQASPMRSGKQSYQWHRNRCEGSGLEPWLADGAAILWAVYRGLLGITPTVHGLSLAPKIPESMADTHTTVNLHGKQISIRYKGFGKKVVSITLNGRRQESAQWTWKELPTDSDIEMVMEWDR